ncbi:ParB N-terminal domain-containing protein [Butyrivibrio sp. AC2005]|uniref:ParB N-terminal domain-containing protein n=1 Tax=Butyrivibrio sp. AC2005 TaxID=1280672 RepID=UPI0004195723|nr:ParB N-terminal domain-containing protein [Butyrivibrio sp. AC2005]
MAESGFMAYLKSELEKYNGVYVPVKASWAECLTTKSAPYSKLHPNPNDEFCIDKVGPSFRILDDYAQRFRAALSRGVDPFDNQEPLEVEKVRPDGYMILNGHHRWAAAIVSGIDKIPIKIVNITHIADIEKMLKKTDRTKRVTFDLDEVVFDSEDGSFEEVPGGSEIKFPERVRLGIPALFHFFHENEYDVWVFSSKYYSIDYIKKLFKNYAVDVDGIVTGTARKMAKDRDVKKEIESLVAKKYKETVSVDNEMVVRIYGGSKDFDQHELDKNGERWSAQIMKILGEAIKNEKE